MKLEKNGARYDYTALFQLEWNFISSRWNFAREKHVRTAARKIIIVIVVSDRYIYICI